jgi:orotate phosphoribosyltransferase
MKLDIMAELEKAGAVLTDRHFVYASGKHGSGYINMDPIFTNVKLMKTLGDLLMEPFASESIQTVAAPATGGIVLGFAAAAAQQGCFYPPAFVWADKKDNGFVFERAGFEKEIVNSSVLVVEDLLTTGGSVAKVCREVERLGGKIVGVSAVCNRGGITAEDLGVDRLETIASVNFEAVDLEACPLCMSHVSITTDVGHGDDYQKEHPDYPGGYVTLF